MLHYKGGDTFAYNMIPTITIGRLVAVHACMHAVKKERRLENKKFFECKALKCKTLGAYYCWQSCSILAYSHCKLVTVSRVARTQEGRVGLLESTEPGMWALDGRKQEGL